MTKLINQFAMSPNAQKIEPDLAVSALRDLMDEGKLQPGDRLPPERELTSRLGVTRTTLRKALEEMERAGEIWRHVGKGTFVAAGVARNPSLDLVHLGQTVTPMHMMRARLSLEPAIAREAAINAVTPKLQAIRAAHQRALDAESWDLYEAADDALHRAIADATGNQLLLALFDQLNQVRRAVAWDTVIRGSDRPPATHGSFAQHERIVHAIETRDAADAHEAMRVHLGSVSGRLFGDV